MNKICKNCETSEIEVFTNIEQPHLYGWPKYWRGATPDTPQDADFYFCGSKCATDYYNKEKDDIQI